MRNIRVVLACAVVTAGAEVDGAVGVLIAVIFNAKVASNSTTLRDTNQCKSHSGMRAGLHHFISALKVSVGTETSD
jgi:hypothetical protein